MTGLAFLGAGVGTSYAIQSTSRGRQADAACDSACTPQADRLNDEARRSATVAQVAFAVGLVALGGAAYLWFTEPAAGNAATVDSGARRQRSLVFDMSAGPGTARAWLGGSF